MVVDTDVMVDYLRGQPQAVEFVRAHAQSIALSAIGVAELYAGIKGQEEKAALDAFLRAVCIIPVTGDVAARAGLLKAQYGPSYGLGLADAIIAATVQAEECNLATLNVRQFPMLADLEPAYLKP